MVLNAVLENLPAILTALGSLIAALVSAYVAVKQARADVRITALTDAHNANHPENSL